MRAIVNTADGIDLMDLPEPQIVEPDDVKIRVKYCGICGSDLHVLRKEFETNFGDIPYRQTGHEACGIITELGEKATSKGLKVGDRVVYYYNTHCGKCFYCRSGKEQFCENMKLNFNAMADYIVANEQSVFKIPDDLSMERAALIEPISVCLHGIDLADIKPGDSVLISGGGTMGLLLLQLAKRSGGTKLTLSEPIEKKRELALELGAEFVIDPTSQDLESEAVKITDGRGFDIVIECSGAARACEPAYNVVGRGGRMEFFAALYPRTYDFPLNLQKAFFKEVTIIGGVFQSPYTFPRAIEMAKHLELDKIYENGIYKVGEYSKAYESQLSGKGIKTLIDFD